ncbi:MAG: Crp/Fnr family transcriptional regulator [Hungatella sp.]|nr:Crp/Fnr family transcriptional regulator [Hungatella sp.]
MKIQDVIRQEPASLRGQLEAFFARFPEEAEVFIKEVPPGDYLIREGDPCFYVYCVLDGRVTAQHYLGHNAFVVKNFGRLTIMGDIAALGNLKYYSTSIRAITACRMLGIRFSDYWDWLFRAPDFLRNQVETALEILLEEQKKKRALEETPAEMRLLTYFAFYCRKANFHKKDPGGMITVKETREKIAAEVGGISVRTVNRKLTAFVDQGLIAISHGKIRISFEQLQKMEQIMEDHLGSI